MGWVMRFVEDGRNSIVWYQNISLLALSEFPVYWEKPPVRSTGANMTQTYSTRLLTQAELCTQVWTVLWCPVWYDKFLWLPAVIAPVAALAFAFLASSVACSIINWSIDCSWLLFVLDLCKKQSKSKTGRDSTILPLVIHGLWQPCSSDSDCVHRHTPPPLPPPGFCNNNTVI